ncbi:ROK family transcriptional regulator [Rhodobacteraceae bacterium RKSG542]|uniref:ROK family transcriptional regulator n=1 Tax=Pseudovibrio flavus TaxID=2529854 RepID=UPI0012BBF9E8|nr:ROK family transcriptional regulator [Pseudovibrio flavus]MTI18136.1 ROK family transcriptional regulator [Pseudovibrio flavus]
MKLTLGHSHKRVLECLRRYDPMPRNQLAALLGLTAGSLTRISRDLIEAGLVCEGEKIASGRGQPALPLALNGSGAYSLGITFHLKEMEVVLLDFAGNVEHKKRVPFDAQNPENIPANTAEVLPQMLAQAGVAREQVLGVGMAFSGYFHRYTGDFQPPEPLRRWRSGELQERFTAELGLPVFADNVANAAALAEFYSGQWRGVENVVCLHLGYGVGGALILNGQPFRGTSGNAGEIGGMFPYSMPRPSGRDLVQTLNLAGETCNSFKDISRFVGAGNAVFDGWIQRAANQLLQAIGSAHWWLAPQVIIIGGLLPKEVVGVLTDALHIEKLFEDKPEFPRPLLRATDIGSSASAIGAAYLPIYSLCGTDPNRIQLDIPS